MIVGNIKRVIRTKILMIFIYAEFIQPTESTYPYMSLPVFTECRNLLIGYIIGDKRTLSFYFCIYNQLLINILRVISQKYGHNL